MAYFYVRDNGTFVGTATGDTARETTARTGAWDTTAANSFESIYACMNTSGTAVAQGDIIYVASDHDHSYTSVVISLKGGVFSVDVTAQDQYLKGATEESAALFDIGAVTSASINGVNIGRTASSYFSGIHAELVFSDASMYNLGVSQGRDIEITSDGGLVNFKNANIDFAGTGQSIQLAAGTVVLDGVSSTGDKVANLFDLIGSGTSTLKVINTDLDSLLYSTVFLDSTIEDDAVNASFHRCKLPASFTWFSHNLLNIYSIKVTSCDNGDGYHYFYQADRNGEAEEDTSNYLSATYDGTNGFSALMSSNSETSIGSPLRYKLIDIPAQDLEAEVDYTINFSGPAALTDTQFFIEAVKPDATTQALGIVDNSSRNTDIIGSGTTHTTYSGVPTWTGTAGAVNYEDTITITGMAGVDNGLVEIWANLTEPNIDVWCDPLPVKA